MLTFAEFQEHFPELCGQRVRLVIADDSLQGRGGLSAMLEQPPVLTVVACVPAAAELFSACERFDPDVAVVDLCLPREEDGLAACRAVKARYPRVRVLMVTAHETARARGEARAAKADGYALKRFSDGLLWKSVLEVAAGRPAFPSYKGGWLTQELPDEAKLQLIDDAAREVLGALTPLLQTTRPHEYGVIKDLLRAHPKHPRLGNDAHVRRVLERIRERLGMKSIAAARWYARVTGTTASPGQVPWQSEPVRPQLRH